MVHMETKKLHILKFDLNLIYK